MSEGEGGGPPEAARRAGDERNLTGQREHRKVIHRKASHQTARQGYRMVRHASSW
jgi:hypothetical protein